MDNKKYTIKELKAGFLNKSLSVSEVSKHYYQLTEKNDKVINSFITLNESFLNQSETKDQNYQNSKPSVLEGIPIAVKDNIMVKDQLCTCGSKILSNHIASYDATIITRLKTSGITILGKTNMDEFAMGSTSESSYYKPVKNPINTIYVPGGSSGGSAAAVAAGFIPAALGSDTGGSVRQPASFCGIVGYKPTYGLLSRWGLVAYGSSLDQIGTLTNTCEDAALLTSQMMGIDPYDSTSTDIDPDNLKNFKPLDIKGLKFGVIKETMGDHTDPGIISLIQKQLDLFKKQGAVIEEISIPELEHCVSIYYIIAPAEASSNLARFDGVRYGLRTEDKNVDAKSLFTKTRDEGFGEEVKRRILIGNFVLSSGYYDAYYKKAQKARILLTRKIHELTGTYNYLITPTSPVLPFKIGENINNPLALYTADLCTIPANLAGIPAVSIPAGVLNGLPVGMQLMGSRFSDGKLLGTAETLMNLMESR